MALVTQSNSGSTFSSLLAPFTGVDNATARLLKAISAAELATLRDGDMVYVESVRDYWKWVPASTSTDDSTGVAAALRYCNPTVNGANPGRFERLFICSPDWLLQDFFIDTGALGHNENSGATTLLPLNNDQELYQRWGDNARIRTARAITYAQTPTTTTEIGINLLDGGSVQWIGTPTITKAGTVLTAVQTQVRTAGAELGWAVTGVGLGAADVNKLIVITASANPANVGAYAAVLKDETGGKLRTSPFGTFALTTSPFTQVTPLVGDTVQIQADSNLNVARITIRSMTTAITSGVNLIVYAAFRSLRLISSTTTFNGAIDVLKVPTLYDRCAYDTILLAGNPGGLGISQHRLCGGLGGSTGVNSVIFRSGVSATCSQVGFTKAPVISPAANVTFLPDCYFQDCSLPITRGVSVTSQGVALFDRATANSAIVVAGDYTQTGAIPDWGANNAGHGVTVSSFGSYTYATKPTVNGTLGAGREAQVGGTDKLYAAIPYIEGANNATLVLTA